MSVWAASPWPVIENSAAVDARVWRGPRPSREEAQWLVEHGVRTVLNLEWEQEDDAIFGGLPVTLHRVKDFEPLPIIWPSLEMRHVEAALSYLDVGPTVCYVHCRSGQNRTGIVCAAYELWMGHPLRLALAHFDAHAGFWRVPDRWFIKRRLAPRYGMAT